VLPFVGPAVVLTIAFAVLGLVEVAGWLF
jgi:hypothetical protein